MSTGGNVPSQGVTLPATPKRGPRGELGKGTPGSRLKSYWRWAKQKDPSLNGSLRHFSSLAAKYAGSDEPGASNAKDAKVWLTAKSGGTMEQKAARKSRRKERMTNNRLAKAGRKKPKQQKKAA